MVTVVNDWVSFYINYYKQQLSGEQDEQDKALQEFRQELNTLSASFLDKYRNFLKSSWAAPHKQPLIRCLSPSPETQAASLRNPQTLPLCSSPPAPLLHGVAAPWHLNKDQFWLWWSSWLVGSSLVPIPESWRQLVPFPSALLPKYGLEDQTS